jgi:hypothetical protein
MTAGLSSIGALHSQRDRQAIVRFLAEIAPTAARGRAGEGQELACA